MFGWHRYASEWWMTSILLGAICAVSCKIWLDNRHELGQLADSLWSSCVADMIN